MVRAPIYAVQVNVLLGFLGVGKTTAIRHLLAQKPEDERWAILVNEFGEIGVDATFLRDGQSQSDVAVKQIPGGCMCCVSGPVTQVSLNSLLRQQRPDRLLVEPSGLGHPSDILRLLRGPSYQGVLQVRDAIVLLDPRQVIQPRYQQHPLFIDQLAVADRIVFNKTDLCTPEELSAAEDWVNAQVEPTIPRHRLAQGELALSWIMGGDPALAGETSLEPTALLDWRSRVEPAQTGQWVRQSREEQGFYSVGWRIAAAEQWDADALLGLVTGLDVLRLKAVLPTQRGWLMINLVDGVLSAQTLADGNKAPEEGVIEVIQDRPPDPDRLAAELADCRL